MSYSILRITNLYNEYVDQYYTTYAGIQERPWREQYDHICNDSFDIVSSTSRSLAQFGVRQSNIFTNATHLQNQWRIENGSDKSGKELIYEQVKAIQPDVLWLDDINLIDEKWIRHVRDNVPSVKLVTGHLCAPYSVENVRNLKALDFLVTCTPCLRDEFESNGIKAFLIYHAFDPGVLGRIKEQNNQPSTDLLFAGSLYTGGGFHRTRIEYIENFLKQDLPLRIFGATDSFSKVLSKKVMYHLLNTLKKMGRAELIEQVSILRKYQPYADTPVSFYSWKLKRSLLAPVYGVEQFKLLSKALLCFNIHGEIAKGCAGNARLFEATGVGTCLVTDWKKNLSDLFVEDEEVITYKTKEECIDKMKWLLQNQERAKAVAKAGHERTMKDHTVARRADVINGLLSARLAGRSF